MRVSEGWLGLTRPRTPRTAAGRRRVCTYTYTHLCWRRARGESSQGGAGDRRNASDQCHAAAAPPAHPRFVPPTRKAVCCRMVHVRSYVRWSRFDPLSWFSRMATRITVVAHAKVTYDVQFKCNIILLFYYHITRVSTWHTIYCACTVIVYQFSRYQNYRGAQGMKGVQQMQVY